MAESPASAWPGGSSEMAGRIRAFDWNGTALGPIGSWPQSLRTALDMVLAMPDPATILWGEAHVQLYNDAYVPLAKDRHPGLLGQPVIEGWPEAYHEVIAPLLATTVSGNATRLTAFPVALRAPSGELEERVFDTAWSPIRDERGQVAGALQTLVEVTDGHRSQAALRESQERQAFLLTLSDALKPLSDPTEIQQAAMKLLAEAYDVMRAGYLDVHADGDTMTMAAHFERDAVPVPPQIRLSDYGADMADAFRAGSTLCARDTEAEMETEEQRAAYRALGVRSWIIAPLVKDGRLTAIVGVVSKTVRDWTPAEVHLVTDIAERTWDAAQRARTEAELRESEGRFRAFVNASSDVVYRMNADWSQMRQLDGRGFLSDTVEPRSTWMDHYILPADQPKVRSAINAAIRDKAMFELEHRVRRADGSPGWTLSRAVPLLNSRGEIAEWLGAASDITERKRTEEALRASEERIADFGEASTDVLWIRDAETLGWTYLTPAFEAIYGLPRDEALAGNNYRSWLDLIEPEDRDHAREMISRARNGERVTFEYRVRRPSDGALRWLRNTDFPIRNAVGEVVSIGGVGHDATLEKEVEETLRESEGQLQVLVAELHHRTRNLIGIVGMIMRQVLASSTSLADFRARFTERLEALSRVQSLLSRKGDEPVSIGDIVRLELDALGAERNEGRIRIEGEAVPLRKSKVQTLSLAIHELATNALKYGALHGDRGHLAVRWEEYRSEANERRLSLQWTETGVEARVGETAGPLHKGGYGRTLLEEALPYTLKAKTSYTLGKDRLDCTIDMPLDR